MPFNAKTEHLRIVFRCACSTFCLRQLWDRKFYHVQMGVIYHIVNNDIQPAIPVNLSREGQEFLQLCFDRDPRRRANCDRLLMHPFVANVTTPASQPATHADVGNTFSPIHEESSGLMTPPSNPPPLAQASRVPSVLSRANCGCLCPASRKRAFRL